MKQEVLMQQWKHNIYETQGRSFNDYRYFPEPDLQPVIITQDYIEKIKKSLPLLPKQLFLKFTKEFNLSEYDTNILIEEKEIALYFLDVVKYNKNYKSVANIVIGPIKAYLNEYALNIKEFNISPERISDLIKLIEDGKVSNSVATSKIFPEMIHTDLSLNKSLQIIIGSKTPIQITYQNLYNKLYLNTLIKLKSINLEKRDLLDYLWEK